MTFLRSVQSWEALEEMFVGRHLIASNGRDLVVLDDGRMVDLSMQAFNATDIFPGVRSFRLVGPTKCRVPIKRLQYYIRKGATLSPRLPDLIHLGAETALGGYTIASFQLGNADYLPQDQLPTYVLSASAHDIVESIETD